MDHINNLGANLIAFCPQRPEFLKQMESKHGITFDILRDEGNSYAAEVGLRYTLPDYLQEIYMTFPLDLPRINGEPSWTLPMAARYVVGKDGVIAAADFNADYTQRPEPEKTILDLQKLS